MTVLDKGEAEIREFIKISKTRPFVVKDQGYLIPKKCVFNRIIGDSNLELRFANYLESCEDIVSYVKNYFAVHFKIDYKNADGDISNFYPDFLVKVDSKNVYVVETKGREDLDDPLKIERLKQWCKDINEAQTKIRYSWLYIKEDDFDAQKLHSFKQLITLFKE
ncbi:MAG: hypothetical protein FD143_1136 [Ignavibacteria bacterium]|nr:MAG: hypothetical protein FD143_1136 [Ignavibacteria bacterium]KAF0160848.1 MAG: hypothetical protein FD188_1347 [Ignavibacteria bacterium]